MNGSPEPIQFDTSKGTVQIRELSGIDDMQAAEEIQLAVWGADIHPHPKEILIPIQHEGGLLAGAFSGSTMAGLVFSFNTRDQAAQHSQILATRSEWRGQGIGARLKWFQRAWCLARSYRIVRWTVDPLRAANAALNIHQLGGQASTYYEDYYGAMQGIDAGVPSDRLLLEWHLDSPRVAERAARRLPDPGQEGFEACLTVQNGAPAAPRFDLDGKPVSMPLPEDFIHLTRTDLALAAAWRMQTRALFLHYFSVGYQITGFTRAGGPAYLLT